MKGTNVGTHTEKAQQYHRDAINAQMMMERCAAERNREVAAAHNTGEATFTDIGEALGVTRSRAFHMKRDYERKAEGL